MVKKFLLHKVSKRKQIYIDLFRNIGIGFGHKWSKYKPKRENLKTKRDGALNVYF